MSRPDPAFSNHRDQQIQYKPCKNCTLPVADDIYDEFCELCLSASPAEFKARKKTTWATELGVREV